MKLNKVLKILLFFSIFICLSRLYASTITKEDIKENLEGTLIDMVTFEDNIMTMKYTDDEQEYKSECEYDLTNNPTFSIYMNFKKDMTEEEYQAEMSELMGILAPFVAVAKEKNIDIEDSMTYIMLKISNLDSVEKISSKLQSALELIQDSQNDTEMSPNFLQNAKEFFTTSNTVNDELFAINYSIITNTEDNFNLKAVITINEDKDFSVVTSFIKEFEEQMENSVKIETTTTKSTTKEFPKAGIDNTLRNILIITVCMSIISAILTNIKYKKIVKNRDV